MGERILETDYEVTLHITDEDDVGVTINDLTDYRGSSFTLDVYFDNPDTPEMPERIAAIDVLNLLPTDDADLSGRKRPSVSLPDGMEVTTTIDAAKLPSGETGSLRAYLGDIEGDVDSMNIKVVGDSVEWAGNDEVADDPQSAHTSKIRTELKHERDVREELEEEVAELEEEVTELEEDLQDLYMRVSKLDNDDGEMGVDEKVEATDSIVDIALRAFR